MTTVSQLLSTLRDKDVSLWVEDDQLIYDAPAGALGPADLELIRAHKPQIIELLQVAAPDAMARTVEIVDRSRPVPSALAQTRMWPIARAAGAGAAYNVQLVLMLRGELDVAALGAALDALVARHEALRTVFTADDGAEQTFAAPAGLPLPVTDLGGLDPSARARAVITHAWDDARTPIDLRSGPLVRGSLLRLGPMDHRLFLTAHHIVTDCRSMEVLARELATLYAGCRQGRPDPLPTPPLQYADFATWQRRSQAVPLLREQLAYWTQQLAGAPALSLPTDRPRPAARSFRGASLDLALSAELTASLRALARRQDVTLSMILHAGWAALLSRISEQRDVLVGVAVANRQRPEIQDLVGLLVNTVVLRTTFIADTTVGALLAQVKDTTLSAHARQELPFEQIAEALRVPPDPGRNPVFQAMFSFALQSAPQAPLRLPGVTLLSKQAPAGAGGPEQAALVLQDTDAYVEGGLAAARREGGHLFGCGAGGTVDLSLSLREAGERIVGGINYAADLFHRTTVERWGRGLLAVLAGMAGDPDGTIRALPL